MTIAWRIRQNGRDRINDRLKFIVWWIMHIGLLQSHSGVAYIIFVAAIVNLVLALALNQKASTMSKIMTLFHNVLIWGGRFNLLIGIALLGMNFSSLPALSRWWGGFALLLWVPVEVVARRMIHPDLKYMRDGASSSRTLILGAGLQLVLVAVIFGIMHAK